MEDKGQKKIGNVLCTTSWDDGDKRDIHLASLLKSYSIPGVFFIPNIAHLRISQIRKLSKDFEIGGHTVHHPTDLKKLSRNELLLEIGGNRKWLQNITGQEITKFCYPRGRYNDEVVEVVKSVGYKEARTTQVLCTDLPTNPYKIRTTIHIFPKRVEYLNRGWLDVALELWEDAIKKENGYYHIWGHSREITKYGLWDELEELLKTIEKYGKQ